MQHDASVLQIVEFFSKQKRKTCTYCGVKKRVCDYVGMFESGPMIPYRVCIDCRNEVELNDHCVLLEPKDWAA